MESVHKITLGSTFRVTWVSSGATPSPIVFNIFSGSETMIGSWAGTSSGNGHYYADVRIDSKGLWKGSWFAFVSPNSYKSEEVFAAFPYDTDQPGRYITWDDVVNRFTSFSDIAGAVKAASHHLAYAENYIDGVLGTKFTVPFSNNNLTVRDLAIDVVQMRAIRSSGSDEYKTLRADVSSRLAALLAGLEVMVTSSGTVSRPSAFAWSNTMDYHSVFSPVLSETLLGPDSDQVDDEEDVRGI